MICTLIVATCFFLFAWIFGCYLLCYKYLFIFWFCYLCFTHFPSILRYLLWTNQISCHRIDCIIIFFRTYLFWFRYLLTVWNVNMLDGGSAANQMIFLFWQLISSAFAELNEKEFIFINFCIWFFLLLGHISLPFSLYAAKLVHGKYWIYHIFSTTGLDYLLFSVCKYLVRTSKHPWLQKVCTLWSLGCFKSEMIALLP